MITEFFSEIDKAVFFENERIRGYLGILNLPGTLISEQSKQEIQEALDWSVKRHSLLKEVLLPVQSLMDHGYPDRVKQLAPEAVIDELYDALRLLTLSVDELHDPPILFMDVSDET